ncbi:MAG TPA: hypothetical protein VIM71_07045 [Lacunisphaera sp.]
MRSSLVFAGLRARSLACALSVAGAFVVSGCQSAPPPQAAAERPAVLVIENLANCAWRIDAISAGTPAHQLTIPVGETVRLELPAGTYEITQEALAGLDAAEATRHFTMPLVSGETYQWRLVTLATMPGGLRP